MISPVPSGFVTKSESPGCAPFFGQIPSGRAVPTTASPYFGSASRIGIYSGVTDEAVMPPSTIMTLSRQPAGVTRAQLQNVAP